MDYQVVVFVAKYYLCCSRAQSVAAVTSIVYIYLRMHVIAAKGHHSGPVAATNQPVNTSNPFPLDAGRQMQ